MDLSGEGIRPLCFLGERGKFIDHKLLVDVYQIYEVILEFKEVELELRCNYYYFIVAFYDEKRTQ